MSSSPILLGGDPVLRRAMFVLELVDPVTGVPAGALLEAHAEGLPPPSVTRAGQLVWRDFDPPADRSIKVSAKSLHNEFAPFEDLLAVAKRTATTPLTLVRRELRPTGLYRPPAGQLAAGGMLIDDENARAPIAGAEVVLVLAKSIMGPPLRSTLVAITDERGGFVAIAMGFGNDTPQPAPRPAPDGSVIGWLEVTHEGVTRKTADMTLRHGRLNYLPEPLPWAGLAMI